MTASEKGKELIEKFTKDLFIYLDGSESQITQAKAMALICCDQVLENIKAIEDNYDDEFLGGFKEFWQSVRAYIEGSK